MKNTIKFIKKNFEKHNITIVEKITHKLNDVIKTGEDKIDEEKTTNVVYKFTCQNAICKKAYLASIEKSKVNF